VHGDAFGQFVVAGFASLEKGAYEGQRVRNGGRDVEVLPGKVVEMTARFDVAGIESDRLLVPAGGALPLATTAQQVAQARAQKRVLGILIEQAA
jgi:hypothetical protein